MFGLKVKHEVKKLSPFHMNIMKRNVFVRYIHLVMIFRAVKQLIFLIALIARLIILIAR